MARSFANVNLLSALLVDGFSSALSRRGFASATKGVAARGGAASISGKIAKQSGEEVATTEKVSWVPDPVTGYYKPEHTNEIDVAELRATLLNKKFNNQ